MIHHIAALLQSPRVPVKKKRRTRRFHRTDHLHVDVHGDLKRQPRFYLCEKIFSRKMVIPRTWIRKDVVFYSRIQTSRRMGQSRRTDDDKVWSKRTTSFPCHESIVPRSAQKQSGGKLSIHYCAAPERLKLFFAQLFLLISSVFTEQSQICVKNTNRATLEQGDLFWWDNLTHCLCHQVR